VLPEIHLIGGTRPEALRWSSVSASLGVVVIALKLLLH